MYFVKVSDQFKTFLIQTLTLDLVSRSRASVGFSVALSATFIILRPAWNRDRPGLKSRPLWLKSRPNCLKSRPHLLKSRFLLWHNLDFWQGVLDFWQVGLDFRQIVLVFRQVGLNFQQVGSIFCPTPNWVALALIYQYLIAISYTSNKWSHY